MGRKTDKYFNKVKNEQYGAGGFTFEKKSTIYTDLEYCEMRELAYNTAARNKQKMLDVRLKRAAKELEAIEEFGLF